MKSVARLLHALAAILAATSPAIAADWTISDLGTLPSPNQRQSAAFGINNDGQVVGYSAYRPQPGEAYHRDPVLFDDGNVVNLGTLGGVTQADYGQLLPRAEDINNNGVIVGDSLTPDGFCHAFSYSNGVMTDIGTLGGESSHVWAINDAGVVVGGADTSGGQQHAFVYSNGVMTDIGAETALGINGPGQVVGIMGANTGFLYSNGVMQALPGGYAYGINDRGLMVGNTTGNTFEDIKAAYYEDGGWHSIGTLGGVTSYAAAVNNRDQIVGFSDTDPDRYPGLPAEGFLYSNGVMTDINSLVDSTAGWTQLTGYAINDRGQITGEGKIGNAWHAVLLTPTMSTFELDASYTGTLGMDAAGAWRQRIPRPEDQPTFR